MIDVERTIISQYAGSATIVQLVRNMNQHIDPSADIDAFFDYVWNVETAQGFGLDIWGRIVGIGRDLTIPGDMLEEFGFIEALPTSEPFDVAPFYSGITPSTQTYTLADDAYRVLILTKALANISATTAAALNVLLQNLFPGRGRCYVNDLGNMKMRYVFEFELTSYEVAIITNSGAMPRPAGVQVSLLYGDPTFGFEESGDSLPFDDGVFYA